MSNKVTGSVYEIGQTKEFGNNGFRKKEVIITQDQGKYDNYICVNFIQDMCDSVDELGIGDEVTIEFRLNGRKWTRPADGEVKYFTDVEATQIASHSKSIDPVETDDEVPF